MNFRRNKPRTKTSKRGSTNSWRKRNGLVVKPGKHPYGTGDWNTYKSPHWPKWWDVLYHTRPWRAKSKEVTRKVLNGADPDGITWPVNHKPHNYYW